MGHLKEWKVKKGRNPGDFEVWENIEKQGRKSCPNVSRLSSVFACGVCMQSQANFKPYQVARRTRALGGNNWRRGYRPQGPVHWGTSNRGDWNPGASLRWTKWPGPTTGQISGYMCVRETLAKPHPDQQSWGLCCPCYVSGVSVFVGDNKVLLLWLCWAVWWLWCCVCICMFGDPCYWSDLQMSAAAATPVRLGHKKPAGPEAHHAWKPLTFRVQWGKNFTQFCLCRRTFFEGSGTSNCASQAHNHVVFRSDNTY